MNANSQASPPPWNVEDVRKVMHLPGSEAAAALGLTLSQLQKLAKELGVKRWPYRRLESLVAIRAMLAEDDDFTAEEKEAWYDRLSQERERILFDFEHNFSEDLDGLRRILWKRRDYKQRKAERILMATAAHCQDNVQGHSPDEPNDGHFDNEKSPEGDAATFSHAPSAPIPSLIRSLTRRDSQPNSAVPKAVTLLGITAGTKPGSLLSRAKQEARLARQRKLQETGDVSNGLPDSGQPDSGDGSVDVGKEAPVATTDVQQGAQTLSSILAMARLGSGSVNQSAIQPNLLPSLVPRGPHKQAGKGDMTASGSATRSEQSDKPGGSSGSLQRKASFSPANPSTPTHHSPKVSSPKGSRLVHTALSLQDSDPQIVTLPGSLSDLDPADLVQLLQNPALSANTRALLQQILGASELQQLSQAVTEGNSPQAVQQSSRQTDQMEVETEGNTADTVTANPPSFTLGDSHITEVLKFKAHSNLEGAASASQPYETSIKQQVARLLDSLTDREFVELVEERLAKAHNSNQQASKFPPKKLPAPDVQAQLRQLLLERQQISAAAHMQADAARLSESQAVAEEGNALHILLRQLQHQERAQAATVHLPSGAQELPPSVTQQLLLQLKHSLLQPENNQQPAAEAVPSHTMQSVAHLLQSSTAQQPAQEALQKLLLNVSKQQQRSSLEGNGLLRPLPVRASAQQKQQPQLLQLRLQQQGSQQQLTSSSLQKQLQAAMDVQQDPREPLQLGKRQRPVDALESLKQKIAHRLLLRQQQQQPAVRLNLGSSTSHQVSAMRLADASLTDQGRRGITLDKSVPSASINAAQLVLDLSRSGGGKRAAQISHNLEAAVKRPRSNSASQPPLPANTRGPAHSQTAANLNAPQSNPQNVLSRLRQTADQGVSKGGEEPALFLVTTEGKPPMVVDASGRAYSAQELQALLDQAQGTTQQNA